MILQISLAKGESQPSQTVSIDNGRNLLKTKCGKIPHRCFEIEGDALFCALSNEDKPFSFDEELSSSTYKEWLADMDVEIESMTKNDAWELVDLPQGRKTIGNK